MKYVFNNKIVKRIYVRVNTSTGKYKFISFVPNINKKKATKFLDIISDKDIKHITIYLQDVKVKNYSHTYKSVETIHSNFRDLKQLLAYFICDKSTKHFSTINF